METLIKNLKDAYWKTRAIAAHRLGETGDATAVHPLIEALLDEERVVRDNAVESLGKIGPGAIVPLINILADQDNHQLSGEVSRALVKIGTRAVKPLVCLMEKCLKNCDEVIFTRVASVLGEIGGPEAVLPLINALNEKNPSIRLDAIRALGKIGDGRAVKPIIDVINKYGSSLEAIEALGKLGGSAAIHALLCMLKGKYRWVAAKSLGMMGDVAVEPLAALLKDKEINDQGLVAMALGYTRSAKAVKPLLCALTEKDRIVSWRAATALVEIGMPAVEPLLQMLEGKNSNYVRMLVADSLGKIGDKKAAKYLERLVNNEESENVKQVLFKALQRLRPTVHVCTGGKINMEKDIFILKEAIGSRSFKATLADDIFYLNWKEAVNLSRGDLYPPIPIPYRYDGGKTKPDDFIWTAYGYLVSNRIVELFTAHKFTGWKTYPVHLYGKDGNLIKGYHGLAVTSQIKLLDNSRSKIIARPNSLFGKPDIVKKGIFFDQDSWDGSDIFLAGYIFITGRVVEALRKASPKVKNWEAIRASEYERSIILDTVEPGFLTDEDRDKINELRRAIRKEQAQNVEMNREIMVRTKITGGKELLHLVRSVVQKHCLFKGMDNYGMCKEILKYLRETGEKVIPQLTGTLKNKDGELRLGAAWLLGELGAKEAIVPLMEALKDEDDRVRREVVTALGKIKDPSTTISLVELLEKEDSAYVRSGIAEMLGEIGDPIAVQPLISLLHNEEDVLVLSDAATSLGKIGDHRAILPLIELFNYEDSNLAECVKLALVNMGQPTVIPLLQSLDHANPLVRERAAATLGQIGEKKAFLPLIDRLAVEKDQEVLVSIAEALGHLGDKRAVRPLLNLIYTNENSTLKAAAQMAVEKIIDK